VLAQPHRLFAPIFGGAQGMKSEKQKAEKQNSGGQQVAHHAEIDRQNNPTQVHWSLTIYQ
jgi:hypothetical protein